MKYQTDTIPLTADPMISPNPIFPLILFGGLMLFDQLKLELNTFFPPWLKSWAFNF